MKKQTFDILERLGPIPQWRGEGLSIEKLEDLYRKVTSKAEDIVKKEDARQ